MGYNNNVIDELKSKINIVDVIGKVVSLTRAGSNFKGVCPFHNEKTPSFIVSESKQIFTCFGCGAKGDAIEFVMKYYNLTFGEAIEKLAEEYNVRLEKSDYRNNDKQDKYYEINTMAARFFYEAFTRDNNPGYAYMKKRGISDATLKKFGVGYADKEWTSLKDYMLAKGVIEKDLLELGLISKKGERAYDKYRDRVMFPIFNTMGKVIGFGGRIIGEGMPKYLNSAESTVFKKKNNLYGLNFTKGDIGDKDGVILVEGYMDLISLYQYGVKNVAASLGTALTENQARLLKRYTKNIVLSYDSDDAGINAALRGIEVIRLTEGRAKVLIIPGEKDPDDYIRKNGKDAFEKLIKHAMPATDFMLSINKKRYDLNDKLKVLEYIKSAVHILLKLSPVERDIYITKLSEELNISRQAIVMEINGNRENENPKPERTNQIKMTKDMPIAEKNLIRLLVSNPNYLGNILDDEYEFTSDLGRHVFQVINEKYQKEETIDFEAFIKNFDMDEENELRDIFSKIIVGADEELFYKQCIDSIKYNKLKREEAEIIDLLAIAEEDNDEKNINELTEKLMKVSVKIRECRSN